MKKYCFIIEILLNYKYKYIIMKKILSLFILIINFCYKIISKEEEKKEENQNKITIYLDDCIFNLDYSKFADDDKNLSEMTKKIIDEIKGKNGEDIKNIYSNFELLNEKEKNEFLAFKNNLKENNYSLEKFKKNNDDSDHYFLEFYKDENNYNNISVGDFKNMTEIYLIKNDNTKEYKIEINDIDIYNEDNVGFNVNIYNMLKDFPFELNENTYANILKIILEKNTKTKDNFKIKDKGIFIDNNLIKIDIDVNTGKEDVCYKKIDFNLKFEKNGDLMNFTEFKNDKVYYKDFKEFIDPIDSNYIMNYILEKCPKKETTKPEIVYFNKIDFKNGSIKYYENKKLDVELKYNNKITLTNITEVTTGENGKENKDEKIEVGKHYIIYVNSTSINDLKFELSSLLHMNLYENSKLCNVGGAEITKDDEIGNISKITIDKDKLKYTYKVTYEGESKDLSFSKKVNFQKLFDLMIINDNIENYILKVKDKVKEKEYSSEKNNLTEEIENQNNIECELIKKENKFDYAKIEFNKNINNNTGDQYNKINEGKFDGKIKTRKEVEEENKKQEEKNQKLIEKNNKSKSEDKNPYNKLYNYKKKESE